MKRTLQQDDAVSLLDGAAGLFSCESCGADRRSKHHCDRVTTGPRPRRGNALNTQTHGQPEVSVDVHSI